MDVQGQHILVLGLARSGSAVAKLLVRHGAHVTVNDQKDRASLGLAVDELEALGVSVITGGHPEDIVHEGLDLLIKNPGIPYSSSPVAKAIQLGIPVITEVEVAYQLTQAPIIGITGSNGKTTTTTLVGEILKETGLSLVVAGNIGLALTEVIESVHSDQWIVAELSSFQLLGTQQFRPTIGVLLNLYQAHLDYHGTFSEYVQAKTRMFANQRPDDFAVINYDQDEVRQLVQQIVARIFPFSLDQRLEEGVFVNDGNIVIRYAGTIATVCAVSEVLLKGRHNLQNALASVAVTYLAGAKVEAIATVLRRFGGVEHRQEFVATKKGVEYYNDSKATNTEAAARAIGAFGKPVILIAGGLDRGTDFAELVPHLRDHVQAIVTIGQAAEKLTQAAEKAGVQTRRRAIDLEEAVSIAADLAGPGDIVLLSPACASWDMYQSFEERGRIFKDTVHRM